MKMVDIINTTAELLIYQGRPSAKKNPGSMVGVYCMYRGDDGEKCAVGHWIKDEDYHENMENCIAAGKLVFNCLPKVDDIPDEYQSEMFWSYMQRKMHDALAEMLMAHGSTETWTDLVNKGKEEMLDLAELGWFGTDQGEAK